MHFRGVPDRFAYHVFHSPFAFVVVLIVALTGSVTSFSDGVPITNGSCSTMETIHGVYPQPNNYHPYFTYPDKQEMMQGERVLLTLTIKLRAVDGTSFKGYMVMAFDDADLTSIPIGTFSQPSDGQLVNCPNGPSPNNAVTHRWSDDKQFVTVYWTPPENFAGTVVFRTTYLQNGTVFWVNTPAAYPVRVIEWKTSTFSSMNTTTIPAFVTSTSIQTSTITTSSSETPTLPSTSPDEMTTTEEFGRVTTTEDSFFNATTENEDNSTILFTTDDPVTTSLAPTKLPTSKPPGNGTWKTMRPDTEMIPVSLIFWMALWLSKIMYHKNL